MGYINVYTGPMKCGKSQRIFNELKRQLIAGKDVKVFKPLIDDRSGINVISTRAGNSIKANCIKDISELQNYKADIFFIDEFQFLNGNVDIIQEMASNGKKFFIAGLNLTSERKPFGKMGDLMCIADTVEIMTSVCEVCKCDNAVFSYYKGEKSDDILIGDNEYVPVCRECYSKLSNKEISLNKFRHKSSKSPTLGKLLVNDFSYQYHF